LARSTSRSSRPITPWLLLALAVIMIDQLTKNLALRGLAPGQRVPVIGGWFDLTLLFNPGAAFSMLASAGGWQRNFLIGMGIVAACVLVWLLWQHGSQRLFATGLALILGGALGNVIDRIFLGQVVDFLLVYYRDWHWPAFNVADSAITVGAGLLIFDELRRVRRSR
jgi:signal peptidase II